MILFDFKEWDNLGNRNSLIKKTTTSKQDLIFIDQKGDVSVKNTETYILIKAGHWLFGAAF